jgi:iron complex transport system substrate-binding protein
MTHFLKSFLVVSLLSPAILALTERPQVAFATEESQSCEADPATNFQGFTAQAELGYAQGFTVDYHDHYKVVTVNSPWRDAQQNFTYLLVQCGTPVPPGYADAQVIPIPVQTVITLSTTHLPHLENLDQLHTLVGVSDVRLINSEAVIERAEAGLIQQVSQGGTLDLERVLELDPDLVLAFGTGDAERDVHPKLAELDVPVALVAEYMEDSPLGRAEWIKFTALFLNQEEKANAVFSTIAESYSSVKSLTDQVSERPTVLVGSHFSGVWYVPGGNSFAAKFLRDAGADYLWADDDSTGSLPLSFEAVFEKAVDAQVWLNGKDSWRSRADILTEDARYQEFAAFQSGEIFIPNARRNENGENDYWESGVVHPHWILADLVKLLHPELLPDHELVYYRQVQP